MANTDPVASVERKYFNLHNAAILIGVLASGLFSLFMYNLNDALNDIHTAANTIQSVNQQVVRNTDQIAVLGKSQSEIAVEQTGQEKRLSNVEGQVSILVGSAWAHRSQNRP